MSVGLASAGRLDTPLGKRPAGTINRTVDSGLPGSLRKFDNVFVEQSIRGQSTVPSQWRALAGEPEPAVALQISTASGPVMSMKLC